MIEMTQSALMRILIYIQEVLLIKMKRISLQYQKQTQVIPSDYPSKKYKNPIIPGGSSFDRIQLEVGVTFKEDQKYKTGGKDFFRKYKRYSVENFQRQVGITQSSPKKIEKKEETKTEPIEEKEGFYGSDFENTEPSAMNNTIHLKTKNLRQAMKNLDLITEEEESAMQKHFNKLSLIIYSHMAIRQHQTKINMTIWINLLRLYLHQVTGRLSPKI